MREHKAAKAARLLAEGRLTVRRAGGGFAVATARGDRSDYEVRYEDGQSTCSCPSFRLCSHRIALRLVVVPPRHETRTQ